MAEPRSRAASGAIQRWLPALALLAACPRHRGGDHDVDWDRSGIDWSRPPAPGPEPAFTPPVADRFTLANGIEVLVVENHGLPLVSVRVVSLRAGAREDGDRPGMAALVADLLDEGAGTRDALGFSEAVEQLGASLDVAIGEDAAVVWLDTLASTLDDSLGLLADAVVRPRFDRADVERVRGDAIEELKLRPQEPRRVAALVFDRMVLGDHPYGAPVSGYQATVGAIERDDVAGFWRDHYAPGATWIVVAGDVDRATLEATLTAKFGDWDQAAPAPVEPPPWPAPGAPQLALIDRPGAAQSVVMIGRRGVAADDPDYFADEVVNTAVAGSFAARVNHRLREELGYTYGAYADFWRGEWGGTWAITTSLRTDVTVKGIQEALAIIAAARTEELPAGEIDRARQLLARAMPQDFETDAGIAGELVSLVVGRRPLDFHQRYVAQVRAVTAAEARAAAAARWADLSIVIVGDRKKIERELARLGLPVVRYDGEGEKLAK